MFRYTVTFLVIFMVVNHDFAAARSFEFAPQRIEEVELQKTDDFEEENLEDDENPETGVVELHSRAKRSAGSAFRLGLQIGAGAAFAFSVGSTIYHAIRKCEDYKPDECKSPTCHYLRQCPKTCHGPQTNRNYVERERNALKTKLDVMDGIQRDAFNLATQAISAGLNNKQILQQIDKINDKVDQLMFSVAQLDIDLATKFRNSSVTIGTLLRNQKLSLDQIVGSQEVDGIFDTWTWEGTGVFVLSLALPLSLQVFSFLRQRYAVNQIYKNLKSDFNNRFVNQKTNTLNPNAKLHNKFAHVQGLSTKQIKTQLKQTAKAIYLSDQAYTKVSKVERIVNNYVAPAVNAITILLIGWSEYKRIGNCIAIANDMQDTAIEMAEKADEIEGIKINQVDPLLHNVTTQAWPRVREMMTNNRTLDWLDGVRNLTLGAAKANATTAGILENFIDNIGNASYKNFLSLQTKLISALKNVHYEYGCLADKQHAITTVVSDCRKGREPFPELYQYASAKHKLNRRTCIGKGMIPYTNEGQFFKIMDAIAQHQGWYSNCLLNSEDLLYRVCAEKIKGYNTPAQIVKQANKTGLTEAMVPNFLSRCPPPKITPKSKNDTCKLYCLYESVPSIAKTVVLLGSQVLQIQRTCPICPVKTKDRIKICKLHYCQGQNATTIEKDVEKPLPTVQHIIANACSSRCTIDDPSILKYICEHHKCRGQTVAKIAKNIGLPESAVSYVISQSQQCSSTVCVVSREDKVKIMNAHCAFGASAFQLHSFKIVELPTAVIQGVMDAQLAIQTCADYNTNGLKEANSSG